MKIIDSVQDNTKNYTATIGFFDGVHKGHQYIIDRLKRIASENSEESLIITFKIHPRKVLHTSFQPQLLTTLSEKLSHLQKLNIDACAVLDFNEEMALMSAFDFMKKILKEQFHVKTLLIGYDHRFGHDRKETFSDYGAYGASLGIKIIEIDKYHSSEHISSSEIRRNLEQGNISLVNDMLGYAYTIEGKVVDGFKVGRKIGFPTANLMILDKEKLIPAQGVYAVSVMIDEKNYLGMLNIGVRPTLENGNEKSIEVHIIDFKGNIYDKNLQVRFMEEIREEQKFDNIELLVEQLKKDRDYIVKKYRN